MKELVVVSGKGGTGKTSITASFAALAANTVIADCDVDAADLHLILSPETIEQHDFYSGHEAIIDHVKCRSCGECFNHCRFDAVFKNEGGTEMGSYRIDPISCEGCGVCVRFCPERAISFPERLCGEWMISDTRFGKLVHARLGMAAENSGKLVSTVRNEARRIAKEKQNSLIIVDGPPGIGCPVIASLTGTSQVLIIAEPTVSGEHALERVLLLTKHFKLPTAVCVNKFDINLSVTRRIEEKASESGALVTGRIRYDRAVTLAQMQKKAVVEIDADCVQDIKKVWERLSS